MSILLVDFGRSEASEVAAILQGAGFEVAISPVPLESPATEGAPFDVDVVMVGGWDPHYPVGPLCGAFRKSGYVGALMAVGPREPRSLGVAALDAGADDFVFRPLHAKELVARVKAVSRRVAGRFRLTWNGLTIDRAHQTVHLRDQPLSLTAREYALLVCLVEADGNTVTRTELLSRVWRHKRDPESNLVEVHLSRLRDKLGPDATMIETVRRGGYRVRR